MKKERLAFSILMGLIIASQAVFAQGDSVFVIRAARPFIALNASQTGNALALGIAMSSFSFKQHHFLVRGEVMTHWIEWIKPFSTDWNQFTSMEGDIVYQTSLVNQSRFFIETGMHLIFPDQKLSDVFCKPGVNMLIGGE